MLLKEKINCPHVFSHCHLLQFFLLLFGLVQIIDVLHPGRPNVAKVGTLFISMRS